MGQDEFLITGMLRLLGTWRGEIMGRYTRSRCTVKGDSPSLFHSDLKLLRVSLFSVAYSYLIIETLPVVRFAYSS